MRVAPKAPSKIEKLDKPEIITQVRNYELITPLFGGGVKAGEADLVTTIRGSSIRGQLRFWWRACRGGAFANLEQMKKAEDAIWGTASKDKKGEKPASKVQVFVETTNKGVDLIHSAKDINSYAAFPLREKNKNLKDNVKFTLSIKLNNISKKELKDLEALGLKDLQKEVEAALWAWETFGGVGARTRRGFGAISPEKKEVSAKDLENNIREGLKKHVIDSANWPKDVPHLSHKLEFKILPTTFVSGKEANNILLSRLKIFRQQRNGNQGRSRWPEPDAIRRLTGQHLVNRDKDHKPTHPVNKFPRAAFGLPIIFHFKDRSDPQDTTLALKNSDRFASPLILRPIRCNNGYVGLAAILEGTQQSINNKVVLKANTWNQPKDVHINLTEQEALKITKSNGSPLLNKETNILKAFLDFLTKQN